VKLTFDLVFRALRHGFSFFPMCLIVHAAGRGPRPCFAGDPANPRPSLDAIWSLDGGRPAMRMTCGEERS
jgi:hypothetical protein